MKEIGCAFLLSFSYAPPPKFQFSYPVGVSQGWDSVPFVGCLEDHPIIPSSVVEDPPLKKAMNGHVEGAKHNPRSFGDLRTNKNIQKP